MKPLFLFCGVLAGLLLAACQPTVPAPTLSLKPWSLPVADALSDVRLLAAEPGKPAQPLLASERHGLQLLSADGEFLAQLPGSFAAIDSRPLGAQWLLATLDGHAQRAALRLYTPQQQRWGQPLLLPERDYALASLCLYRDDASNIYLFLLGEEGQGEQWLVGQGQQLHASAQRVRGLPLPANASYCQVDDASHQLFVSEEGVGLWRYGAHPEADAGRQVVDLVQPFGGLSGSPAAMASVPGGLLLLDSTAAALHLYQQQASGWLAVARLPLADIKEPERLAVSPQQDGLTLLLQTEQGQLYRGQLHWQPKAQPAAAPLPQLQALAQTAPVGRHGDAADDPAIWVHPSQPELSRLLGTNKKQGLLVYDLAGQLLQELPVGRLNNVDVRSDIALAGQRVDLAVASNRDRNSISLFAIDRATGTLRLADELATPLTAIYGICLFQPARDELYVFANDKDGRFLQYRLSGERDGRVSAEQVRSFQLDSQPEGCVADDRRQRLFIGEEDVGVWALDARPQAATTLSQVLAVGELLHADVEGLGLYRGSSADYLLISSQGNDSFVVLDAEPPYAVRGALRVGLNAELGIDGVSETDGLEVTSANLGGPWSAGMLVVQDGRNRLPEASQNFKLVPWAAVAKALALE